MGEAGDIQSLLVKAHGHRHEVLVVDLNMPGGSRIQAISTLARDLTEDGGGHPSPWRTTREAVRPEA